MEINTVIVQLEVVAGDIDGNIKKAEKLLSKECCSNPDLIIFPELWTIGWDCEHFNKFSEELLSSKILSFLKNTALKYNSNIIGGSSILRNKSGKDRNTAIILNRKAEITATYDKYHLFSHRGQSEGTYLEEGDNGLLVNTDIGKIGISICYDIRFPELYRKYAFNGADIMVNMAAWPKAFIEEYITLAKARAIENQCIFLCSCLTGKINDSFDFSGNSIAFDYKGKIINKAEFEETCLNAKIDLEEMRQYRIQMPILKDTKLQYKIMEK